MAPADQQHDAASFPADGRDAERRLQAAFQRVQQPDHHLRPVDDRQHHVGAPAVRGEQDSAEQAEPAFEVPAAVDPDADHHGHQSLQRHELHRLVVAVQQPVHHRQPHRLQAWRQRLVLRPLLDRALQPAQPVLRHSVDGLEQGAGQHAGDHRPQLELRGIVGPHLLPHVLQRVPGQRHPHQAGHPDGRRHDDLRQPARPAEPVQFRPVAGAVQPCLQQQLPVRNAERDQLLRVLRDHRRQRDEDHRQARIAVRLPLPRGPHEPAAAAAADRRQRQLGVHRRPRSTIPPPRAPTPAPRRSPATSSPTSSSGWGGTTTS